MKNILLLICVCASLSAADRYSVDWNKVQSEALDHFVQLIRMDTTNPPGNETKAAEHLKRVLEHEGIPAALYAMEPDRANMVARIKGNGRKRPILVMGHTDVVGVQREKWTVDPFAGVRKDGYLWGRGTLDDKDNVVAGLMLMVMLKRLKVALDRDVIFLAESGEEGANPCGIPFIVDKHWDAIDAEYALAEGGGIVSRDGKVRYIAITTTEKVPRRARLIAHGTAGHGSKPRQDNPVIHIASAVAKVGAWMPPARLNETTRAYFERLATISSPEDAARYNGVLDPARRPAIEQYFAQHDLNAYSILRTSVVPTIIKAGFRLNVIPSEAEAMLDIRALPDENIEKFYDELRRVIGDPAVEVVPIRTSLRPAPPPSRFDTEMFNALANAQKRMFPGAVTVPSMLTGATDMAQLRAKGVQAYGFGPIQDERELERGGAHGDDERILETSVGKLVEFLWYAVLEVAASE